MQKETLTGIIPAASKPVLFYADASSFQFCFMTDTEYSIHGANAPISLDAKDGFLCGKTHDSQQIAIYLGNASFKIITTGVLNTSAYIKSVSNTSGDTDIMEYEAIRFQGKTLNRVFRIGAVKTDHEDGKTIMQHQDDSIRHTIAAGEYNMEMEIRSVTRFSQGIHGNTIDNSEVTLTLTFDKPQPIGKLFDHYNRIKDLISFMTFRSNIGFDKIFLMKTHPELPILTNSAEVYIRNDCGLTEKECYHNLCFEDLGDTVPNLTALFYDVKEREPSLSLGFLPSDDQNASIMNNAKIRLICTALECEISIANDLQAEENKALAELVTAARQTVKDFRASHLELSNDTYNTVFSSIAHWSFPLSEKIIALFHRHEREIAMITHTGIPITDDSIKAFVKYRNDITHGKHRIPDLNIALTAKAMSGLVYCSILSRIGLSRERILELCEEKILT